MGNCCTGGARDSDGVDGAAINGPAGAAPVRSTKGASGKPTERTPLLAEPPGASAAAAQEAAAAAQREREQEALKKLVQRTTDNLINITSSEPTNRVSASAAANRSVAYKQLLASPQTAKTAATSIANATKPNGGLTASSAAAPALLPVSPADAELITRSAIEVAAALNAMTVRDVGPVVQTMGQL